MKKLYSLLLLGGLLLFGVQSVWAWTINGRVYFDNTNSDWTTSTNIIQLFGEKSDGSSGLEMTAVANTKLYYWSGSWGDGAVSSLRFACTKGSAVWGWSAGNNSWTRLNGNDNCVGMTGTWGIDVNGKSVLFVSGSGTYSNTTAPDLASVDTYDDYSSLNSTQTIYSAVMALDGTGYTVANSKATISITSYELTAEGTTTKRTPSLSTLASSQTVSAARTATTTLSVGSVESGYEFVGWFDGSGNLLSSKDSYVYYPTEATSIYARFYPTNYTRSDITASGIWGTICLPVDGEISDATLYSIVGKFGGKLYVTSEGTTLTAGMPYLFKSTASAPSVVLANTAYVATPLSTNGLYGRYTDQSFEGWNSSTIYVVRNEEIQKAMTGTGVGNFSGIYANRAFIDLYYVPNLDSAPSAPSMHFDINEENNATSIDAIEASEKAVKFIENGKLFIQKNGVVYDTTGRVVR